MQPGGRGNGFAALALAGLIAAAPATLLPPAPAEARLWEPDGARIRRLLRVEYDARIEQGFLVDERVELRDGRIVERSPRKGPHAMAVEVLARVLGDGLRGRARIDRSEPEPDIAVVSEAADRSRHPRTAELIVVHTEPADGRYGRVSTHGKGTLLRPERFPDVAVAVDEVLG